MDKALLLARYKGLTRHHLSRLLGLGLNKPRTRYIPRLELLLELHTRNMHKVVKARLARIRKARQAARALLLRAVRRRFFNRPVNTQDPIMLDELCDPLFRYVTKGPSPRVYAYNLKPLLEYVLTSARFVDPMSGVAFNELEVLRLEQMRQRYFPELQPSVNLTRLAFDEAYIENHNILISAREFTMERVRESFHDLRAVFDRTQLAHVLARYVRYSTREMHTHVNNAGLLDPDAADEFLLGAITQLRADAGCPPPLIQWMETLQRDVQQRRAEGWSVSIVDNDNAEEEGLYV